MRHRKKTSRLSGPKSERQAQVKSSVRNLILYERIKTTTRRAKVVSAKAEELINTAKRNDLHSKRLAYSFLQDHKLVKRLFEDIAPRFKEVKGGCVRRIGFGFRKGDGAELSLIELTALEKPLEKKNLKKKEKQVPKEQKTDKQEHAQEKEKSPKKGFKKGLKKIFQKKKNKGQ